jgi:tetratricopeptide (TPR) repeat protein
LPSIFRVIFFLSVLAAALAFGGCTVSHPRLLPKEVTVGPVTGPAGALLADTLRARTSQLPMGGEDLIFEAQTEFSYRLDSGREKVLVEPRTEITRPSPANDPQSSYQAQDYDLMMVLAELKVNWLLKDHFGQTVRTGTTVDTLKRNAGGYLAALGAASKAVPDEKATLKTMTQALANQLILELGPVIPASAIIQADDEFSRKAYNLASSGNWAEAAQLWQELLVLNPKYSTAHYNLGLYHERRGELELAWSRYRQAFLNQSTPINREALTRITDSLERQGRSPKPGGDGFSAYQ